MKQYQAGYITDFIEAFRLRFDDSEKLEGLLGLLSHFEMSIPASQSNAPTVHPLIAVAHNLIIRGLPTRASVGLEQRLADLFGKTAKTGSDGRIEFAPICVDSDSDQLIYRALHIIDPRISASDFEPLAWWPGKTELGYEDDFFMSHIPAFLGKYAMQLVDVHSMATDLFTGTEQLANAFDAYFNHSGCKFADEVISFVFRMPYEIKGKLGMMVEFDDHTHYTYPRRELDLLIGEAVNEQHWAPMLRITEEGFSDMENQLKSVQRFLEQAYFDKHKENYILPLYGQTESLDILQLTLTPFAVARLQRAVIELVLNGTLPMDASVWRIAIIERDIPCGELAMADLQELLTNLFILHGEGLDISNMQAFPDIVVKTFYTQEFAAAKGNFGVSSAQALEELNPDEAFDLLIDFSILGRNGIAYKAPKFNAKNDITIRSARRIRSKLNLELRKPIQYESIYKKAINGQRIIRGVSRAALNYLTQSFFRKDELHDDQLALLDLVLQRKNSAGLLPPRSGKSLVFHLAALLQPAPSVVITPLTSLTKNQLDRLWRHHIEQLHWINMGLRMPADLRAAFDEFEEAQSVFNFVAPEFFRNTEFRKSLAKVEGTSTGIAYCIIDEIHCCSEWSHDFKSSYFQLPKIIREFIPRSCILGLSGTSFNNTIFDIQSQLGIEDSNTVIREIDGHLYQAKVELVELPKTNTTGIFSLAKDQLARKKQVQAVQIATKFNDAKQKAIFYTPYNFGFLGITDRTRDGLADKLRSTFPNLKIGAFVGTDVTYNSAEAEPLTVSQIKESREAYESFYQSEADFIVSSSALAVGIDLKHYGNVIHLNMPASIESFIQKSSRGSSYQGSVTSSILFNNKEYPVMERSLDLLPDGSTQLIETTKSVTIDEQILMDFHYIRFRGEQFDLDKVLELLQTISWPDFDPRKELQRMVEQEYELSISFMDSGVNQMKKVLIFIEGVNLGMLIHEESWSYKIQRQNYESGEAILQRVVEYFNQKMPTGDYKWFFSKVQRACEPGIIPHLQEFRQSQKDFITYTKPVFKIGFENDTIDRICDLLKTHSSQMFNEAIILRAFAFTRDSQLFIENLHRVANVKIVSHEIDLPKELASLYYKIRRREDTLVAVQQLSTIGVIDDYLIDEYKREVEITLSPVNNEYYVVSLYKYMSRYISHNEAYKVFAGIYEYAGDTVLEKSARFLINFVYNSIAPSRLYAMNAMVNACKEAVDPEGTEGELTFGDLIELLLQSKYAHATHQPNLITDTKGFTNYDLAVLKQYIDHTGYKRENWYHLRSSTETLLENFPDNYVLMLLKAYSILALSPNDTTSVNTALELLAEGIKRAGKNENWDADTWKQQLETVIGWIKSSLPDHTKLREAVILKIHLMWLRTFNAEFLSAYSKV
ncbi:MAG: hypothetical protein RIS47_1095 [Bacteroidota bacterium]